MPAASRAVSERLRDHDRDDLRRVRHPVGLQHRELGVVGLVQPRRVGVPQHREHAIERERSRGVDVDDASARRRSPARSTRTPGVRRDTRTRNEHDRRAFAVPPTRWLAPTARSTTRSSEVPRSPRRRRRRRGARRSARRGRSPRGCGPAAPCSRCRAAVARRRARASSAVRKASRRRDGPPAAPPRRAGAPRSVRHRTERQPDVAEHAVGRRRPRPRPTPTANAYDARSRTLR